MITAVRKDVRDSLMEEAEDQDFESKDTGEEFITYKRTLNRLMQVRRVLWRIHDFATVVIEDPTTTKEAKKSSNKKRWLKKFNE